METGEYEFGTSLKETMTIISGALTVMLPDATDWKTFKQADSFIVEANETFQLKVQVATAYLCTYK